MQEREGRKQSVRLVMGLALAFTIALTPAGTNEGKTQPSRSISKADPSNLSGLPAAAQGTISARLGRDLPAYRVLAKKTGFEARNAKRTLTADFTSHGVTLHASGAAWGMSLRGVGYGEHLSPVAAANLQASANRVEYRRGSLTEWYVNGPVGLEQGFTLNEPPGRANGEPLTIELGLSGNLTATVDAAKTGLTLSGVRNGKLRYAGLAARDAVGKELRASLEVQGGRLLLKADDAGALYPVTIDPFVQLAELTASDGQANDVFGFAVAISGNTLVVGADGENDYAGAAYVYVKPASGWQNMTETAKLTASDGASNSDFGDSISIWAGTIAVGAGNATVNGNVQQGAVYVFVEPPGGWVDTTETAKLTALDGGFQNFFGASVATTGSTIVVGATGWNASQGKAYVFVEPPGGWQTTSTFTAILTDSLGAREDEFGSSVSIGGSTVVIGVPLKGAKGSVDIFVEPKNGWVSMTQRARLTASDGVAGESLGCSVSINGSTVAAGARGDNIHGQSGRGAAYVFVEPAGGWKNMTQTAKLTASDGTTNDELGSSVAISGNAVVAGAPQENNTGPGKAYMFVAPGGVWGNMSQTAELKASDGVTGAWFGLSVALNGNTVAVGGPFNTVSGNANEGASYVFGP